MNSELIESFLQRFEQLERRLSNLIRSGRVEEVDEAESKVRVRIDEELLTPFLTVLERAAGEVQTSSVPTVGEGVIVLNLTAGQSLAGAFVLRGLNTSDIPPLKKGTSKQCIQMPDGTSIEYDSSSSEMLVDCVGDLKVKSAGLVNVVASEASVKCSGLAKVDAAKIELNGGAAGGAVGKHHGCPFTGSDHCQGSETVFIG